VSKGNLARLRWQMVRARSGQPIILGAIGGSITGGSGASTPEAAYLERIASWWKQSVSSKVAVVNAGVAATGSNYGALRAQRDLLQRHPDVVIVEFAVNDPASREASESLEGLCRQILREPNHPAVILLFMVRRDGWSAEDVHVPIGEHYRLPMISFRQALLPEIQAGRLSWDDILIDQVHPNDRGHGYAALFVTDLLCRAAALAERQHRPLVFGKIRHPLVSDRYEHVVLREARDLQPVRNSGWSLDGQAVAWVASTPGSMIEFAIEGKLPLVMVGQLHGPMGRARITVDDGPIATILDGYSDEEGWGSRVTAPLPAPSDRLSHIVRVEILRDLDANSMGHEFRILGLGGADADR
jgi:lysophospholipase L1-like esterase